MSGDVAFNRVWSRVQWFVLAWILCVLPNVLRVSNSGKTGIFERFPILKPVALSLFAMKGLFNSLVYAVQSRYVHRTRQRMSRASSYEWTWTASYAQSA